MTRPVRPSRRPVTCCTPPQGRPRWCWLAALLLSAACSSAFAQLRLPRLISDHMALQSGRPVPIWGWAAPGEAVTVAFAGQTVSAQAGADGRWQLVLAPLQPDPVGRPLQVSARDTLTVQDVIVGEVWLASGQSNMEKPVGEQRGQKPTFDAAATLAAAQQPALRLFKVAKARSTTRLDDVDGQWLVCTPRTLDESHFSAAAYFFGRELQDRLQVGVGLIDADWGGTRIEPWTPPEGFDAVPALAPFATAARSGQRQQGTRPAELFNAMVAPLVPYALRGVIWYQGESNIIDVDDGEAYAPKLEALIHGWRATWAQELPFYYVQIAPYLYHLRFSATVASPEAAPRLREAQARALRLPATGMVGISDTVDDLFDIHPRDKKTVGQRLARLALQRTYGRAGGEVEGPTLAGVRLVGQQVVVSFTHADGLTTRDGKPPTWFQIAGADGRLRPARAEIREGRIVLSHPDVPLPAHVRFAWDEAAQPNLMNAAGLPALQFRADLGATTTDAP